MSQRKAIAAIASVDPRIVIAFALVYVIWGSTYLAIRIVIVSIPPFASAGVRFFCAGLLMLTFNRMRGRAIAVPRSELVSLAVIGFLLLVCANGLVSWAEQFVPSGLAALMAAVLPLWIGIIETLLPDGERLPPLGWAGVLLGIGGLAVLLSPKLAHGFSADVRGEAAVMLASLCWATGSLYSKRVTFTVSPFIATGWEMLIGGSVLVLIAGASGQFARFAPSRDGLLALAYLILVGSCVGFSAFVWLLQHVAAAKVTTYAYVNPVVAVVLGSLLLGEPFTPAMALGTPIIVAAVVLVTTAKMQITRTQTAPLSPLVEPARATPQRVA
ncbi:MAG TPA: EamA family transporter [Candidatus Kryptonia bacterium]|nr:EamA family transporter [Candidatus Kryptonia bacterium]